MEERCGERVLVVEGEWKKNKKEVERGLCRHHRRRRRPSLSRFLSLSPPRAQRARKILTSFAELLRDEVHCVGRSLV